MANPIPTRSREIVRRRDHGLCCRCGHKGGECHHRRGRSVRDEHTHCPCNLITLCRTCHSWAHANPTAALSEGLIVLRRTADPFEVPVRQPDGWWSVDCEGGGLPLLRDEVLWFQSGVPHVLEP